MLVIFYLNVCMHNVADLVERGCNRLLVSSAFHILKPRLAITLVCVSKLAQLSQI